ncbi:MAG: NADH:flavin oxidoreductase/NADH oxidase [Bradyrhizobium sp.]|uniref:NADH:flavin oxidoreductase/NADH oxidase n=1 Tax=Bradyrhizobium sp. TaxID=376 RepID=UPI00121341FB|nr:NADH:flavin oxidoreductase/NADH oxidase [Bradyrhizobium sp.]THD67285.1 MAG: NADH:flavin oxidoreductase/NADH oxidase [Bradyrhizobium sp.]
MDSLDPARPLLFQPLEIRGLTLKNRLVVPPMVHYRAGPGSTCDTFHIVHLGRFALGGFGLVFVEATAVEEIGLINEHDLGIWNDAQVQSFKPLIAFMKSEKTAIGIQLAHGGRKSSSQRAIDGMGPLTPQEIAAGARMWQPVGPTSEPVAKGWLTPRQLTTEECKAMVRTWGAAARRAVDAGFDAIEIHTAHGYLLASFLSPVSNTRNDRYGGDREGRMRLPLEIAEAVRREMPQTMPLFVRVSAVDGAQDGWNLDDTVVFARELKARGVDVIDCSSGGISGSATAAQVPRGLGFQVPFAERVRKEVGIPTMAVGIILEARQAEAILQNKQADLIAVGRQAQFNPNIAQHWAHDLGINQKFEDWPPEFGWWLEKRIRTIEGFATPTGIVRRGE